MRLGQLRPPAIPFWCGFLSACCILVLPACADRGAEAAQNAVMAQQALSSNDLPTARAAIMTAIAERDDVVDYHLLRGRIELAAGSEGAAYNAYTDALALDATNGEAMLAVAQLGLRTGNLRESLEATETVLTLAPDNQDALLVRGIHAFIKRNYPEAIQYGDKILSFSPGNEGGTILKSRALFMSRKPVEALAALEAISGSATHSEAATLTRLEIYRALHQPSEMVGEFARLRELRPDDMLLRIDEANLRFKTGDRPQAHELVAKALAHPEADLEQADLALALWQEYGTKDVPPDAFERINREGSIASRQAFARFLLRHKRAREARATIQALPEAAAASLRARYLVLTGQTLAARKLATTILERDSTDCDALIAASEASLKRRKADDALRYAQLASAECPNQPTAWLSNARAYQALKRTSGVNRVFVQALEVHKQSSDITAAYTSWLISEGRPREAIAMARRLTRYAPALISGWRLYEDICRRFDASCVGDASRGLATAQTLLGVDLPPGTPPPNGLFGRLVAR